MVFLKERIGQIIKHLDGLRYPVGTKIGSYRFKRTAERYGDVGDLDTSDWETFDTSESWGGDRAYFWFASSFTVPPEYDGKCLCYRLTTGREGEWDARNPQFSLYVNGSLMQGMDVNHTEALLTGHARAGEVFRIVLSAFTGDHNDYLKLDSQVLVLDRKTEKYYYDLKVPYDAARLLPEDSDEFLSIIPCLNESVNLLDLRQEYSPAYYASLERAERYLEDEFYGKRCGTTPGRVLCVGHTHIDVAWLWTLSVTRDKAVRSFSTVLELMREYPEYKFLSSQPQLYQFVKEEAPEIYAQIKRRVAEGRWEADGGMWVEADCNLASGESLVRQFVHGIRFFESEFGVKNEILWLPDTFGYSAALPQIMKGCELSYFMTTKLSWNEFDKMPYDTFLWEGIDGTRVLTHFVTARDFIGSGGYRGSKNSYENNYFTTYNGNLNPSQIKGAWQRYQQKDLNDEVLFPFGYGDGGGGPTKEMLENQRRTAKGIPGCPRTRIGTADAFFHDLEKSVGGSKYLPLWVGELYLEYHRGTYTSMGRNKRYNRKSELTYQDAELFSTLASLYAGEAYPERALESGWHTILLNQFHDILPGSAIREVYDESKLQYEQALKNGEAVIGSALQAIAGKVDAPENSVVVFNPNGFCGAGLIRFAPPAGFKAPVLLDGDSALPVQASAEGDCLAVVRGVPSKGYRAFRLAERGKDSPAELTVGVRLLENSYFRLELNAAGQFTSMFDKRAGRELLKAGGRGNVIVSYEDRPHNYDAWDINNYYTEKSWEVDEAASIEVLESGPVRGRLRVTRNYLDSTISQDICIYSEIPRIDILNDIDWKEKNMLLKTHFPFDLHTSEATFDIQYGNARRATHSNTSWDFARFEVCMHKWLDLSEDGYGVSVLNDCKYGVGVRGGDVGLTMLKSAVYPNPAADKERHVFTYSIYPHAEGWRQAGTVSQAYQLNNPLRAAVKAAGGPGSLPAESSFVRCDRENVVIEVVKKALDSDAVIVRLYECHGRRTKASLTFGSPLGTFCECNLLERHDTPLAFEKDRAAFEIRPYEIKTFKLTFAQK